MVAYHGFENIQALPMHHPVSHGSSRVNPSPSRLVRCRRGEKALQSLAQTSQYHVYMQKKEVLL
jgi:hypothetical protein